MAPSGRFNENLRRANSPLYVVLEVFDRSVGEGETDLRIFRKSDVDENLIADQQATLPFRGGRHPNLNRYSVQLVGFVPNLAISGCFCYFVAFLRVMRDNVPIIKFFQIPIQRHLPAPCRLVADSSDNLTGALQFAINGGNSR